MQSINSVSVGYSLDKYKDKGFIFTDNLRKWKPGENINLRLLIINQPNAWYSEINPFHFLINEFDFKKNVLVIPQLSEPFNTDKNRIKRERSDVSLFGYTADEGKRAEWLINSTNRKDWDDRLGIVVDQGFYEYYDLKFVDASLIIEKIGGIQAFFVGFFGLLTASWFNNMFHKKTNDYLVNKKNSNNPEKQKEEMRLLEDSRKIEN